MKGIQIIYSPSWNRWNINSEVCRLEYVECGSTGEIDKRLVLDRIFAYLKDQFPEKEFVQISPDEWQENVAPQSDEEDIPADIAHWLGESAEEESEDDLAFEGPENLEALDLT